MPELVPICYGRMSAAPFAFYPGAAYVMASDLAGSSQTGMGSTLRRCAFGQLRRVRLAGASLGPNDATPTAVAHWRAEQRIERSRLQLTFLRPSCFMQNLLDAFAPSVAATGLLAGPFGNAPIVMVDIRDVAACAVAALLADGTTSRAWQLTGPRPVRFPMIAEQLGARHVKVPARPRWQVRDARRRGG